MTLHFPFQNTYAALPANFFARVNPTPVASPRLIKLNRPLAVHLGLVFAFFLTMPYGKFVHGIYRFAALVRYAQERGK